MWLKSYTGGDLGNIVQEYISQTICDLQEDVYSLVAIINNIAINCIIRVTIVGNK